MGLGVGSREYSEVVEQKVKEDMEKRNGVH